MEKDKISHNRETFLKTLSCALKIKIKLDLPIFFSNSDGNLVSGVALLIGNSPQAGSCTAENQASFILLLGFSTIFTNFQRMITYQGGGLVDFNEWDLGTLKIKTCHKSAIQGVNNTDSPF